MLIYYGERKAIAIYSSIYDGKTIVFLSHIELGAAIFRS